MIHGRTLIVAGLFTLLVGASAARGAPCAERKFELVGRVLDTSNRPLSDAGIYLLMDKVSKDKFLKEGLRGRSSRTDRFGQFQGFVACGTNPSGYGDPCGSKIKHVTVIVDHDHHRMVLKTYKFNDLTVTENPDGTCTIAVPDVSLKGGG